MAVAWHAYGKNALAGSREVYINRRTGGERWPSTLLGSLFPFLLESSSSTPHCTACPASIKKVQPAKDVVGCRQKVCFSCSAVGGGMRQQVRHFDSCILPSSSICREASHSIPGKLGATTTCAHDFYFRFLWYVASTAGHHESKAYSGW